MRSRQGSEQVDRDRPRGTAGSRRMAWLLDEAFRVPGTNLRFGLDPVLGLIPGGGDAVGGALSAWIILSAARQGAPSAVLLRMGGNVALDLLVGAIPVLGDLFDAGWKANRRNMALLEGYAARPEPVTRRSRAVLIAVLAGLLLLIVAAAALTITIVRMVSAAL